MKKLIQLLLAASFIFALTLILPTACSKAKAPAALIEIDCTDSISFSQQVLPIIQANCASCHDSGAGTNPVLSNYAEISENGIALLNTLKGSPQLMTQGGPALPDSLIRQIQCWIQQGKQNN
ncbi:cytochrome c [Fluviicola taffensis]|uniref:Cytochrome c domain-containing protein n=1 Tax=Fluviicola taffensis (strain DSM 16823 / NCIMB 13979 / RW262) TaxID=755732 RepID=F2IGL1_FLUTR|nr:cytochrome c [Fluviicola taffensis]AEA42617.1 hypothetical protein Fluta_0613 [Fluviicola taffensis DSM 16823]